MDKKEKSRKVDLKKIQEEVEKLKISISQKDEKINQLNERLIKVLADYDNLQKRVQKDVEMLIFNRVSDVSEDLMSICDDLNFAIKEKNKVSQQWVDGILAILEKLPKLLLEFGLSEIETKEGDKFEPGKHEAVSMVSDKTKQSNSIVGIVQKGYMLEGKIVRPTRVIVNKV